jgi:hypothetical protein
VPERVAVKGPAIRYMIVSPTDLQQATAKLTAAR